MQKFYNGVLAEVLKMILLVSLSIFFQFAKKCSHTDSQDTFQKLVKNKKAHNLKKGSKQLENIFSQVLASDNKAIFFKTLIIIRLINAKALLKFASVLSAFVII